MKALAYSDNQNPLQVRLEHLVVQAWHQLADDPLAAGSGAREAQRLARNLGDSRLWFQSLFISGVSALYANQTHEGLVLLLHALGGYRSLEDEQGEWACLKAIAKAWDHLGDKEQASEAQMAADALGRAAFPAGWLDGLAKTA
jgi:hypothetical protein